MDNISDNYPDITDVSYSNLKHCRDVHVGPKIYLNGIKLPISKEFEIDNLDTIIADLGGYLHTQYRNTQAWICTQPWLSNEECHISTFFIPPKINPITLSSQGWFIDGHVKVSFEQLLIANNNQHPPKRILLQGESGSGKSTLLRKLAFDWAIQKDGYLSHFKLLFLLQLKYMNLDIHNAVEDQILKNEKWDGYKDIIWDYVRKHQDQVLFLLDGYDEMPSENKKTGTFDRLCKGITIPEATVIITCRSHALIDIIKHCDVKFSIRGFGQNGINSFISHFIQRNSDNGVSCANAFTQFLLKFLSSGKPVSFKSNIVNALTQNPLMLNLLCTLLEEKYTLSSNINSARLTTAIYLGMCHCFYQRTLERMHIDIEQDNLFVRAFKELGLLCLRSVKTKQYAMLANAINSCTMRNFLWELGLLRESSNGYWELLHSSFVEFLAAFYLKMQCLEDHENFKQELQIIIEESYNNKLVLPLQVFVFLGGLLQENAHVFINELPRNAFNMLSFSELISHLSYVLQECGESDANVVAIQKFIPECLSLDRILTPCTFTNITSGFSMFLGHRKCTVSDIIISSDTILSYCLTDRDAFYQFLAGLCNNTSIRCVDIRMYTSYGNFAEFGNRENIKAAFRELCEFGLSNKEKKLESVIIKYDFSFEEIAQEVCNLLRNHSSTLISVDLEATNKKLNIDYKAVEGIICALKDNQKLEKLSLKGFSFNIKEWKELSSLLENTNVKLLSLYTMQEQNMLEKFRKRVHFPSDNNCQRSFTHMSSTHFMFTVLGARKCALQNLDFSGTLLSSEDIICLAKALQNNVSIKFLTFFNSCAKLKSLHPLLTVIADLSSITGLYIGSSTALIAKEETMQMFCTVITRGNISQLSFRGIIFSITSVNLLNQLVLGLNSSFLTKLYFMRCTFDVCYKNKGTFNSDEISNPKMRDCILKKLVNAPKLKNLHLHISTWIQKEKTDCIKQIEIFQQCTNLEKLNISGDSTIVDDILFQRLCNCLSNLYSLKTLIFQNYCIRIMDEKKCIGSFSTMISKLSLQWLEFKGCLFDSQNNNEIMFSKLTTVILNSDTINNYACSWVNLFGKNYVSTGCIEKFVNSLKINHTIKVHVKGWPKDFINDLITSCKNQNNLFVEIRCNNMCEIETLIFIPMR